VYIELKRVKMISVQHPTIIKETILLKTFDMERLWVLLVKYLDWTMAQKE
jgi:hypothetical protein